MAEAIPSFGESFLSKNPWLIVNRARDEELVTRVPSCEFDGQPLLAVGEDPLWLANVVRQFYPGLDDLWSSIRFQGALDADSDCADHHGQIYRRWSHRNPSELNDDLQSLRIDTYLLRSGVRAYLRHPAIHSEYLDWYCADALTYCEYIREARNAATGRFTGWLVNRLDLGKWRHQQRERVSAMRDAYHIFDAEGFGWDKAWQQLNRASALGAGWPEELLQMVTMRRRVAPNLASSERGSPRLAEADISVDAR